MRGWDVKCLRSQKRQKNLNKAMANEKSGRHTHRNLHKRHISRNLSQRTCAANKFPYLNSSDKWQGAGAGGTVKPGVARRRVRCTASEHVAYAMRTLLSSFVCVSECPCDPPFAVLLPKNCCLGFCLSSAVILVWSCCRLSHCSANWNYRGRHRRLRNIPINIYFHTYLISSFSRWLIVQSPDR